MLRKTILLLALWGAASPAWASSWAEGLFDELSRDFGTVPRGQMLVHPFRLVNNSKTPVSISNVRVSCGCTSARALQHVLAPGQETYILAQFDSRRVIGFKAVTIYVSFDQPRYEEVRLLVQANSRDDVVFAPESLAFGKVKPGNTPNTMMTVSFFGHMQIQVVDVKCDSNYIQPKVQEIRRELGEVVYQVSASLRPDIPEGKWYTDIWLTTNDAGMSKLRVPITVEIETPASPGSANPQTQITLGKVRAGEELDRKVILRGTQPFRITSIQGADKELIVRPASNESKTVHVLTVTVRPSRPGQMNRTIRVQTDMQNNRDIEFKTQANVVP